MAFCSKCGTQLKDDARFCTQCGTPVEEATVVEEMHVTEEHAEQRTEESAASTNAAANAAGQALVKITDTSDTSAEYTEEEKQNGKVMGILSYLGFLVLIPIFAEKDNRFVRFHANQGLVLLGLEIIYNIVVKVITKILYRILWPWPLSMIATVISAVLGTLGLVFLVWMILGIVNVCNGKAKELPIIGGIRILK